MTGKKLPADFEMEDELQDLLDNPRCIMDSHTKDVIRRAIGWIKADVAEMKERAANYGATQHL